MAWGSQYILQYAAYQKSPLVLGGYTLFLLWRHGWWLIPRIHSCRSSRINERCSFDTGRALHCTYLYTHQPGTPDEGSGSTGAFSPHAACSQTALCYVARVMGNYGIWHVLRAHHGSPDGQRRPLELVPTICPVLESPAGENHRGVWQCVWSLCCLVYRSVALFYGGAHMGACKAHSRAVVSLVCSFHCACQSFVAPLVRTLKAGYA